jgi:D-arabinose 1-dehydrogenase-like Zn-dependent alcohol dehydrogenase
MNLLDRNPNKAIGLMGIFILEPISRKGLGFMDGAKILLLGLPYAHRQYTFESIVAYDKMLVGSVGSAAKHFDTAIELMPQLDLAPFTDKVLPLSEYKTAWELKKNKNHLKVILEIN